MKVSVIIPTYKRSLKTGIKVTVVVPVYNEGEDISKCLESLSRQDYQDIETIIVDDGSTDDTLSEIQNSKFKAKVFRQVHKGAGAARNLGARHARGQILVFVDGDMYFQKDFITRLVAPILTGRTIGTFSKEEYLANKDNIWAVCANLNRHLPKDRMHPKSYPNRQKVFRAIVKSEFDKAGGFNEKAGYTDDWSLSERLGKEAWVAPGAVFYHKNPDSLKDVFAHAKWVGKRRYKLGTLGVLVALIRVSLPFSIFFGLCLVLKHGLWAFFPYKLTSDFGQFLGILEYQLTGKAGK